MDLDFWGVENGMEKKGKTGRWTGTSVSKKKCHVGSIHLLRLFLPSPLCKKKEKKG